MRAKVGSSTWTTSAARWLPWRPGGYRWNRDISGCQSWEELPKEAKAYVEFLEEQLDHPIQFISTGAQREKFVLKGAWL